MKPLTTQIQASENRKKLKILILQARLTQHKTAEILAKKTGRPCSLRTVQAWLTDPGKPTSIPCPNWAVSELQSALKTITPMPAKPTITKKQAEENRKALRELMKKVNLTQQEAAEILAKKTGRSCSRRILSAWLADPNLPSSRICPNWAVIELKHALHRKLNH